jgi:hypothetical protein
MPHKHMRHKQDFHRVRTIDLLHAQKLVELDGSFRILDADPDNRKPHEAIQAPLCSITGNNCMGQ